MRATYEPWTPNPEARQIVQRANAICADYQGQGYDLTLRQLYYQFVARDAFPEDRTWTQNPATGKWYRDPNGSPNAEPNYNWLGDIVSKARMGGLLDWDYIVDRTRNLERSTTWANPQAIVDAVAQQYAIDRWQGQSCYVEAWVEKEALAGIVGRSAERWQTPFFACRGYVSLSEMHGAARRLLEHVEDGRRVVVLHLGDHDPSGIDMTRDITDRLDLFMTTDWAETRGDYIADDTDRDIVRDEMAEHCGIDDGDQAVEVRRIALNWDQIQQYAPPPNPAKLSDSRSAGYVERFGIQSWELDALEPAVLDALVDEHVSGLLNAELWDERLALEAAERVHLERVARRWVEVVEWLGAAS